MGVNKIGDQIAILEHAKKMLAADESIPLSTS